MFQIKSKSIHFGTLLKLLALLLLLNTSTVLFAQEQADASKSSYDDELSCFCNIIEPKYVKEKKKKPRLLLDRKGDIIKYLDEFVKFPYVYVSHSSKKEGREGIVTKIEVWNTNRNCNINTESPDRIARKIRLHILPVDYDLGAKLIRDALKIASPQQKLIIAYDLNDFKLKEEAYISYFLEFNNASEINETLDKDIRKVNDLIRGAASLAAIETIQSINDLREYFSYFNKRPYFYEEVFDKTREVLRSTEILELIEDPTSPLSKSPPEYSELLVIDGFRSIADFIQYTSNYPESKANYRSYAGKRVAELSFNEGTLISVLLAKYNTKVIGFRDELLPYAIQSIQTVEDCQIINQVFDNEADIQEVLSKASTKLSTKKLLSLMNNQPYLKHRDDLLTIISSMINSLNDVDLILKSYPLLGQVQKQELFLKGVQFAEAEGNEEKMTAYLTNYLNAGGQQDRIRRFLTKETLMAIARKANSQLKRKLAKPLLLAINGNDMSEIDAYLSVFPNSKGQLLDEMASYFRPQIAIKFYEKHSDPDGIIERVFPTIMNRMEHIDWYIKQFGENDHHASVLLRGARLAKNQSKKFDYLANYFEEIGQFSKKATAAVLPKPKDILEFIKVKNIYSSEICDYYFATAQDLTMVDQICEVCKMNPEDLQIGVITYNAIDKALSVPPFKYTIKHNTKTSRVITNMNTEDLGVLAIGFKAEPNSFPISVKIGAGDNYSVNLDFPSADEPLKFLNAEDLKINGDNLVINAIEYSSLGQPIELIMLNFPEQTGQSDLEIHFYNDDQKEHLITSINQLILNNNGYAYQDQILEAKFLGPLRESQNLRPDQVNQLMLRLAARYLDTYEVLPQNWWVKFKNRFKKSFIFYKDQLLLLIDNISGSTPSGSDGKD